MVEIPELKQDGNGGSKGEQESEEVVVGTEKQEKNDEGKSKNKDDDAKKNDDQVTKKGDDKQVKDD